MEGRCRTLGSTQLTCHTCWRLATEWRSQATGLVQITCELQNTIAIIITHCIILYRHDIMVQCWAGKAENRPTFSDLVSSLSEYLESLSGYTPLLLEEKTSL